ncbi:MAG: hypothetical protein ACLTMR_06925 [Faecalibacillus sp.]
MKVSETLRCVPEAGKERKKKNNGCNINTRRWNIYLIAPSSCICHLKGELYGT